jgi:hypothetical protein
LVRHAARPINTLQRMQSVICARTALGAATLSCRIGAIGHYIAGAIGGMQIIRLRVGLAFGLLLCQIGLPLRDVLHQPTLHRVR